MIEKKNVKINPTHLVIGAAVLIFGTLGLFWVAGKVFALLRIISPILILATLFIDHRVVLNYGKMITRLFKRNPIMGIGAGILSVVGFPIVILYLFAKALLNRQLKKMATPKEVTFAEYEEIADDEIETLELPEKEPIIIKPKENTENSYERFFD